MKLVKACQKISKQLLHLLFYIHSKQDCKLVWLYGFSPIVDSLSFNE